MGTWMNNDGLYLKYGVQKTTANTGGDYKSFGDTREVEFDITMAGLTTSAVIQNDTIFFPAGMTIESVQTEVITTAAGGTSLSIGTVKTDRSTAISTTTFLSAAPIADHTTAGQRKDYTVGVTGVGGGVGTTISEPAYITALAAGTYSAGKVRVRIRYRGEPPITQ